MTDQELDTVLARLEEQRTEFFGHTPEAADQPEQSTSGKNRKE